LFSGFSDLKDGVLGYEVYIDNLAPKIEPDIIIDIKIYS